MSDKKLVELIEEYGNLREKYLNVSIEDVSWKMVKQTKQAIVDYVEGEKQDAMKEFKRFIKDGHVNMELIAGYVDYDLNMNEIAQAASNLLHVLTSTDVIIVLIQYQNAIRDKLKETHISVARKDLHAIKATSVKAGWIKK